MDDLNESFDRARKRLDLFTFAMDMSMSWDPPKSEYEHRPLPDDSEVACLMEDIELVRRIEFYPQWMADLHCLEFPSRNDFICALTPPEDEPTCDPTSIVRFNKVFNHKMMCLYYFKQV